MSKRKYNKGRLVESLSEIIEYNDFLYMDNKILHSGWWQSFQFRALKRWIKDKRIWFAESVEKDV